MDGKEGAIQEIDRSPSISVFLSAESFFRAGHHLHKDLKDNRLNLRFNAPIYYLFCHALELTLKAFLRSKGFTAEELRSRRFGHNLLKLWNESISSGLGDHSMKSAFNTQIVELLDPFATTFEFRYLTVGFKQLPELGDVENSVADLMAAVKPHCLATLGKPISDNECPPIAPC